MASVIDPRKPKLLVPLLIGDWINNIAACGLAISLAVSENMTRKIFGAYGLVLLVFQATICIRNGLYLLFNSTKPQDEDSEPLLESASHLFLTGTFGWIIAIAPFYWEFISWRALRFRMQPTFFFYFMADLMLVDVLFAPVLLYALTLPLQGITIVKLITSVVSILFALVRLFIKKCCPWCPKIKISPEKGESPDDPTPY